MGQHLPAYHQNHPIQSSEYRPVPNNFVIDHVSKGDSPDKFERIVYERVPAA